MSQIENEAPQQPTPEQIVEAKANYISMLKTAFGEYVAKEFKVGDMIVVNNTVAPLKRGQLGIITERLEKPINMLDRVAGMELTSGIAPSIYDHVAMFIDQSNGLPVTWCIDSRDYKLYNEVE